MHREHHRWFSPSLGRDMDLLIFGHAGARVLVFPTSMGKFYEWEDRGMIAALGEHLERGWLQLYCVDSVDVESWYCRWAHPGGRAWRHVQYEQYIINEVLPLSRQKNSNQFMITAGASFGAYHALNFAFRHPYLVGRAIGLSGIYTIDDYVDGYTNDTVYLNNPCLYIPNEHEHHRLEMLRNLDIVMAVGADDPLKPNNDFLSSALWNKSIWHAYHVWDGWAHDWPWWHQMIRLYINGGKS